jgi:hypothetical protein
MQPVPEGFRPLERVSPFTSLIAGAQRIVRTSAIFALSAKPV